MVAAGRRLEAGVSSAALSGFEVARKLISPLTEAKVTKTLEAAGVIFAEEMGTGQGLAYGKHDSMPRVDLVQQLAQAEATVAAGMEQVRKFRELLDRPQRPRRSVETEVLQKALIALRDNLLTQIERRNQLRREIEALDGQQ